MREEHKESSEKLVQHIRDIADVFHANWDLNGLEARPSLNEIQTLLLNLVCKSFDFGVTCSFREVLETKRDSQYAIGNLLKALMMLKSSEIIKPMLGETGGPVSDRRAAVRAAKAKLDQKA